MIFLSFSSLNPLPQALYLFCLLGKKKKAYVVIFSRSPNPVMSRPSKRFGLISFLPPAIPISNPQAHPRFRRRLYKNLILRAQFLGNHHLTDNCGTSFVSEGFTFLPTLKYTHFLNSQNSRCLFVSQNQDVRLEIWNIVRSSCV